MQRKHKDLERLKATYYALQCRTAVAQQLMTSMVLHAAHVYAGWGGGV